MTLGFWNSPSNKTINGIIGTSRQVDFQLGDKNSRANLLNEQEVATIIREDGFRLWGIAPPAQTRNLPFSPSCEPLI